MLPFRESIRTPSILFAGLLLAFGARAQEPAPAPPAAEKPYKLYGWLQAGFAANFESPEDRINFGANFDWRSNDFRLNQLNFVFENPLEHEEFNVGYRVDFLVGHDAPFFAANGLFDRFTGLDPTSGVGQEGIPSYRNVHRIGIDLPQFYVDFGIPNFLTRGGVDFRVGKFYTLMGREVYPAPDTDFYSRTWENVVGTPFTHTGILATVHATGNLDLVAGVVEGWDVRGQQRSAELPGGVDLELDGQAAQLDDRLDYRTRAAGQRPERPNVDHELPDLEIRHR